MVFRSVWNDLPVPPTPLTNMCSGFFEVLALTTVALVYDLMFEVGLYLSWSVLSEMTSSSRLGPSLSLFWWRSTTLFMADVDSPAT